VFRISAAAGGVVAEALRFDPVAWIAIGVIDEAAATRARGVTVLMNRCPAIELRRLFAPTLSKKSSRKKFAVGFHELKRPSGKETTD